MVRKPISHDDGAGAAEEKERKGLWSPEEDERLYAQITRHGVSTWSSVAQLAAAGPQEGAHFHARGGDHHLLAEGPCNLQFCIDRWCRRWSVIAARMPGRTDNEIKNYWNSRIRKRRRSINAAGGCTKGDLPAETSELTPAGEKESIGPATAAPPIPVRLPVFACQLHGGDAIAIAGTQSTTTHEQNAGSQSEVSVGNGGEDAREHCYCAGNGDSHMIHLLSFDDLEYLPDLLMDVPVVLDAWESKLY